MTLHHGVHPSQTPFRYIALETHDAALNMALDEACADAVREGYAPPTVRLYRWSPSAITIGNFQCVADEVDRTAASAADVMVVRRLTGGGAVYHDVDGEVTYSIIAPEHLFPMDVSKSYEVICAVLLDAFAELGIAAAFRPVNDITVEGRKLSGNAQTRRGGVLVQHGTILLTVDPMRMFTFLTPDKAKLEDKPFVKSVQSAVTSLAEHGVADRNLVEHTLREAFKKRYPGELGEWSERELARAATLVRERYATDEWNAQR